MNAIIKIGVRTSLLAYKQGREAIKILKGNKTELITIATKGDKDKKTPLRLTENSNFFTYEIEEALRKKEIDIGVHSAKDLEEDMPKDLTIALKTNSISKYDCLVSKNNLTLKNLAFYSVIGTSSVNRSKAVKKYRKDLITKDIRGNVDERLRQLDQGKYDAVIVAYAAMVRLGLKNQVSEILPFSVIKPHPLQGRLALQVLKENKGLIRWLRSL